MIKYLYLVVLVLGFLAVFFTMGRIQESTERASKEYANYLIEQGY